MTNFDFHNLLFPTEFENFCRDLLEIREPNTTFTTYKRGRDGGIDIKATNAQLKIIGQCKLYHPKNYSELIQSLKKEVTKCKRQKPDRYIVCTNIELTPTQAEEIKTLFTGFILNEEDIIDGIKLNKYLGQKEYEYLFKTYSKLLVPNFHSIELALDKVVNKKYYNKTKAFFDDISARHKLFHNTEQLPHLIQQLENSKVIVLSGNPGVGKTTTAIMMANYFFNRKNCDIIYLEERDYPETLAVAGENRLIIVDDFWGQNFSPAVHKHSTFQREFQSIIKYFTHSSNSYLILVSREYVIKDVLINAEHETETLLDQNKYVINIDEFSFEDKLRIFINHLLFYDYDLSYIKNTKYEDGFEYLLEHTNYTPRHLDFFIKTYLKDIDASPYRFYKSLREYLDNPLVFWKDAFGKLNPTSQLILLILLISSDPMGVDDLEKSFDAIQVDARQTLGVDIAPLDFRKELIKLEEFYISIEQDRYYSVSFIQFQSPGIKDYLLEFLRTDGYLWIKPIITNALFFNQLNFVFTTTEGDEISDYESDIYLHGKKIVLDKSLRKVLKQKLLSGFDHLHFSNYDEREFSDQLTRFNPNYDIKYLKLLFLHDFFDTGLLENDDVRGFMVAQVLIDINQFHQQKRKIVSHKSMIYFPDVIKHVYSNLDITADQIIRVYHSSITFANEYNDLYRFKNIFPLEFQKFHQTNLHQLKKHIKELIFEDIQYYLDEEDGKVGTELDTLRTVIINDLAKNYKFRITKKLVEELESTFGIGFSSLLSEKKTIKSVNLKGKKEKKEKYKPKSYAFIIDEYLPPEEEEMYNPIHFLKEHKYHKYIIELQNEDSALSEFKREKLIFEDICHFSAHNKLDIAHIETYKFIDVYFERHANKVGVNPNLLADFYYQLSNEFEQSNEYSTTKSTLDQLIKKSDLTLCIQDLNPIVIPFKNWYRFGAHVFEKYFLARHISSIADNHQFKEQIIDAAMMEGPEETQTLKFLQAIDKKRLWDSYIIPELKRLIGQIDFTSEKATVLSFIKFFSIEFKLDWKKKEKTFERSSSSCSEWHYDNMLLFYKVEFYANDFELYFVEEYQGEDSIKRLTINPQSVKKLNQIVRQTIKPERSHFVTGEAETLYNINLSDFLEPEENYQIAREVGIITYVFHIIEEIKTILSQ
jgi:DNA polymerase III delta prime subunit